MRIVRYLHCLASVEMFYNLNLKCSLQVCTDIDFIELWLKEIALDPNSILSRIWFAIMLFGCFLFWISKLETEIALSITKAECIIISQKLRNVIPLINLMNELIPAIDFDYIKPIIKCSVFEDNQSTIAIAKAPSMLPRTKYISLEYHHFRQFVLNGTIDIQYVNTTEQIGDMFAKPLSPSSFTYLQHKLMKW